jgi:hypothetical protein
MAAAVESELDAVVNQAFALEAGTEARHIEEIDRTLFQHAGSHAAFDIVATAILDNDGFDPIAVKQVRQQQPGRTGSDDANLGA